MSMTAHFFYWPDYRPVTETPEQVAHIRYEYAALLSMCDASLGNVLDMMDRHHLWDDTMLIVGTDHGFLLGEHDWWGKWVPPWYDELIHNPLFIWDPRFRVRAESRAALVQTIDFGPTLLDYFNAPRTPDMQGVPLTGVISDDTPVREAGLFGMFGGMVNVTDGRYVYMRAPAGPDNTPLYEHTLMPTVVDRRADVEELRDMMLAEPFTFTKGVRTLKIPAVAVIHRLAYTHGYGTMLFDLKTDPGQMRPLVDDDQERRMIGLMVGLMKSNDAPPSQYERLGLPENGDIRDEHLALAGSHESTLINIGSGSANEC